MATILQSSDFAVIKGEMSLAGKTRCSVDNSDGVRNSQHQAHVWCVG